ncbi:MAG: spermidine synthase [Glaciecola sp.]|jgi:spermidine synthase
MSALFEALGDAETPSGTIRLWRRRDLALNLDVYEVKLGDEYLMTSVFPDTEIALATVGLGEIADGENLDVVVGGLGLGYTAKAVLQDDRVHSLVVVEFVGAVIEWHEAHLVPASSAIVQDGRARLVHGDFFAMAQSPEGLDPEHPGRTFDAILVDIDHTPEYRLDDDHGSFYTERGLRQTAAHLRAGGIFGFWSDGLPIDTFTALLGEVFDDVEARVVTFDNPVTRGQSSATIYVGRRR